MAQKPQTEGEPPKKRGMLLIIISLVVVLLGAGGGAAWYFMKPADNTAEAEKPKPALFLPLEMFTANLASDGGQAQFIQVGLTLKIEQQATIDSIKERMPEVRNRILLLLSGQRGSELLPVAGKEKLATEIAAAVRGVIGARAKPAKRKAAEDEEEAEDDNADGGEVKKKAKRAPAGPAIEVLFTSFMIQ